MPEPTNPETVAPLRTENLEQYLLYGRREIRQLLQNLIAGHALITAHLVPGHQSFLTALITLSEDDEWIFLDIGPDPVINHRALKAEQLACVTQLDKIRIQFALENVTEIEIAGRPAFAAPVPDQMLRLQRREYYRLRVPLAHCLTCHLPADPDRAQSYPVEARVVDISAGGVGLVLDPSTTTAAIGTLLNGCRLTLPDGQLFEVVLEIRNVARQTARNGIDTLRMGCRFAKLPRAADVQIQRYIFRTERERNAHERGDL